MTTGDGEGVEASRDMATTTACMGPNENKLSHRSGGEAGQKEKGN